MFQLDARIMTRELSLRKGAPATLNDLSGLLISAFPGSQIMFQCKKRNPSFIGVFYERAIFCGTDSRLADDDIDNFAEAGFDAVYLRGVWQVLD